MSNKVRILTIREDMAEAAGMFRLSLAGRKIIAGPVGLIIEGIEDGKFNSATLFWVYITLLMERYNRRAEAWNTYIDSKSSTEDGGEPHISNELRIYSLLRHAVARLAGKIKVAEQLFDLKVYQDRNLPGNERRFAEVRLSDFAYRQLHDKERPPHEVLKREYADIELDLAEIERLIEALPHDRDYGLPRASFLRAAANAAKHALNELLGNKN